MRFRETDHWALKAIALVGLGGKWQPVAVPMIDEALTHRDLRLRAYGLEALLRSDDECLKSGLSRELFHSIVQQAEIVALLRGLSPKFLLGLVHCEDLEDFKNGARLLSPLTETIEDVQEMLDKLIAGGEETAHSGGPRDRQACQSPVHHLDDRDQRLAGNIKNIPADRSRRRRHVRDDDDSRQRDGAHGRGPRAE
jgi:hypothetical protein